MWWILCHLKLDGTFAPASWVGFLFEKLEIAATNHSLRYKPLNSKVSVWFLLYFLHIFCRLLSRVLLDWLAAVEKCNLDQRKDMHARVHHPCIHASCQIHAASYIYIAITGKAGSALHPTSYIHRTSYIIHHTYIQASMHPSIRASVYPCNPCISASVFPCFRVSMQPRCQTIVHPYINIAITGKAGSALRPEDVRLTMSSAWVCIRLRKCTESLSLYSP